MKPTTDIVEELRLYNRWRRGDEAITAPDPTALGKLLDDAADRIEHLFASGIHTCHADCQRPMCVLRRERDKAQADLARVTAELEQVQRAEYYGEVWALERNRAEQAEKRVAELDATIAELTTDGNAATLASNLAKASKRNAELVAALDYIAKWVEADGSDEKYDREILRVCALARAESGAPLPMREDPRYRGTDFRSARAESATPAKHPDTERLDWLEEAPSERLADVRRIIWQQRDTCMVTRAAIDSAMKEHQ